MAKQTFTASQVLTAQQMNDLQTNDFNQTVSTKTAAYTFVASDRGTRVVLNDTTGRTFTIDNNIFSAGDTIYVHNINTGILTIAAGAGVTLNTPSSATLDQWQSGTIYATSASSFIFFPNSAGVWTSFTPTFTNLTVGNAGLIGAHMRINKWVFGYIYVGFGSTTSVGGTIIFNLPFTAIAGSNAQPMGWAKFGDGATVYLGYINQLSTTTADFWVINASATYATQTSVNATIPFTWGLNDELFATFSYRIA